MCGGGGGGGGTMSCAGIGAGGELRGEVDLMPTMVLARDEDLEVSTDASEKTLFCRLDVEVVSEEMC